MKERFVNSQHITAAMGYYRSQNKKIHTENKSWALFE